MKEAHDNEASPKILRSMKYFNWRVDYDFFSEFDNLELLILI